MDNHQADNNRTDDRIHHHGHWRYLIHTTFALLGAAALFLHFSGGGVGGGYYTNFLHGSSSSPKEEGGRRRHDLLRVTSSSSRTRRRTQLLATCNRFHRDPQQCNQIPGCQHNRTACVPRDMMVLQFANKDADVCSQHNSFGRRCKRSGCAWNRLARTCSMPSHECEPFNGRTRVCNSYDQCVFNRNRGVCELMSETTVVMDECTKKTYRACRFDTANCRWQNRQCVSSTTTGTGTQATLVTLATQLGTTTTTKATTAQAGGTTTTTTAQAGGTTTTTTAQAGGTTTTTAAQAGGTTTTTTAQAGGTTTTTKATTATTTTTKATTAQAVTTTTKATTSVAAGQTKCLEWHPLVGQSGGDAPICTNTGKVPEAWTKYCQNTNGIIFFQTGQECCAGYFKNAAGCSWKTEQELQQASATANACWSWHPSVTDPKTCTNDENYPAGWKQGCPHYNGQLFFETYDSCCDNYFKGLPKTQCNKVDVMNQNSAGLTTTTTTTKATTAATTTTKATTAATTTKATTAAATTTTTKATTTAATTTKATTAAATTTTTKATTIATTTTPKPSPEPTPGPTQKPTMKPSSGPTAKPTSQPTEPPTKPPSPGPTAQPTKPPSPVPTSPPTRQPTLPPQAVKWYPLESVSGKTCVQGSDYNPSLIGNGWTYNSEDACCKAWNLPCGVKAVKWYPATSNGAKQCVEGTGYPWSFFTSGFLYTTKEKCCQSIQLDCSPKPQKWKPTLVNGEKACVFMEVETYDHQFDSKGECCAAFPLACPTTTTTTTTTRPAVTTPPCTPSGGKGCHWWPKLEGTKIKCVYSSNWPIEASEVLFPDHDACYCEFNAC